MLNVFLTVDTEISSPLSPDWRQNKLAEEIDRDIMGHTTDGDFGIGYQLEHLSRAGLKANWFVESLFVSALGDDAPLRKIVNQIKDAGQDVQLHLHSEWLERFHDSPVNGKTGQNIRAFSEDEQKILIALASRNLKDAGAERVCAYRAGNFGADFLTLRALAANGIRFDTSYNICYLSSCCGLHTPQPLLQPQALEGLYEYPVSFFSDWPGHWRPAQLCACSSREMEGVLLQAWGRGWQSFVIVWHSFELIKRGKGPAISAKPDWTSIERFNRLCAFLKMHADKFDTRLFSEIDSNSPVSGDIHQPLTSSHWKTIERVAEQALGRLR
jgi:hypothetical protein